MRAIRSLPALFLLFASVSTGCQMLRETPKPDAVDSGKTLASLQADSESLKREVSSLQHQLVKLQAKASRYSSVSLNPTEKGYQRIDTTSGFFLVALKDVEKYVNGYRLVLAIGNPTAASYEGFNLTITWQKNPPERRQGEPDEEFTKRFDEWVGSQKEKEYSFTETLHPASWNTVKVVVAPATAEELEDTEITAMNTSSVVLARR